MVVIGGKPCHVPVRLILPEKYSKSKAPDAAALVDRTALQTDSKRSALVAPVDPA